MEYERELKILEELKIKIQNEKDINIQNVLIDDYFSILSYLEKLKIINANTYVDDLNTDLSFYFDTLHDARIEYCHEFISNINLVKNITTSLMKIYKNYPIKPYDVAYCNPIDIYEGMDILYDFFGDISNEFYEIFKTMAMNSRISIISNISEEGITYDAGCEYGQFIILNGSTKKMDYQVVSALAHEIGHCYELHVLGNNKRIMPLYLLVEVIALFTQKMFDNYNIENNLFKNEALYNQMIWQGIMYQETLVNDFIHKCLTNNTGIKLDSYNFSFKYFKNRNSKKYINSENKTAINKYQPSLNNYLYVIGDLVANNFVELYKQDKKECLKLLNEFILTNKNMPFSSNLAKFSNHYHETERLIKEVHQFQKINKKK